LNTVILFPLFNALQNAAPVILRVLVDFSHSHIPFPAVCRQLLVAGRVPHRPGISRNGTVDDEQVLQPFMPPDIAVENGVYFLAGIIAELFRREMQFP